MRLAPFLCFKCACVHARSCLAPVALAPAHSHLPSRSRAAVLLQLVEGSTLTLGSAACLLITLGPLWWRVPALGLALLLGLLLSGLEGFATGLGARALNLKLRQSLGRMCVRRARTAD